MTSPLHFTQGDLQAAAGVVRATALHQEALGRTLWPPASVTPERLARHYPASTWHVAWRDGAAVGAFSLLDTDPPFWPDDPPGEAVPLQQRLNARQFCDGEGALHRVVAPCIEEDHDGRSATEEFWELQHLPCLILQDDGRDRSALGLVSRCTDR